jgi:hypothetical protein
MTSVTEPIVESRRAAAARAAAALRTEAGLARLAASDGCSLTADE